MNSGKNLHEFGSSGLGLIENVRTERDTWAGWELHEEFGVGIDRERQNRTGYLGGMGTSRGVRGWDLSRTSERDTWAGWELHEEFGFGFGFG